MAASPKKASQRQRDEDLPRSLLSNSIEHFQSSAQIPSSSSPLLLQEGNEEQGEKKKRHRHTSSGGTESDAEIAASASSLSLSSAPPSWLGKFDEVSHMLRLFVRVCVRCANNAAIPVASREELFHFNDVFQNLCFTAADNDSANFASPSKKHLAALRHIVVEKSMTLLAALHANSASDDNNSLDAPAGSRVVRVNPSTGSFVWDVTPGDKSSSACAPLDLEPMSCFLLPSHGVMVYAFANTSQAQQYLRSYRALLNVHMPFLCGLVAGHHCSTVSSSTLAPSSSSSSSSSSQVLQGAPLDTAGSQTSSVARLALPLVFSFTLHGATIVCMQLVPLPSAACPLNSALLYRGIGVDELTSDGSKSGNKGDHQASRNPEAASSSGADSPSRLNGGSLVDAQVELMWSLLRLPSQSTYVAASMPSSLLLSSSKSTASAVFGEHKNDGDDGEVDDDDEEEEIARDGDGQDEGSNDFSSGDGSSASQLLFSSNGVQGRSCPTVLQGLDGRCYLLVPCATSNYVRRKGAVRLPLFLSSNVQMALKSDTEATRNFSVDGNANFAEMSVAPGCNPRVVSGGELESAVNNVLLASCVREFAQQAVDPLCIRYSSSSSSAAQEGASAADGGKDMAPRIVAMLQRANSLLIFLKAHKVPMQLLFRTYVAVGTELGGAVAAPQNGTAALSSARVLQSLLVNEMLCRALKWLIRSLLATTNKTLKKRKEEEQEQEEGKVPERKEMRSLGRLLPRLNSSFSIHKSETLFLSDEDRQFAQSSGSALPLLDPAARLVGSGNNNNKMGSSAQDDLVGALLRQLKAKDATAWKALLRVATLKYVPDSGASGSASSVGGPSAVGKALFDVANLPNLISANLFSRVFRMLYVKFGAVYDDASGTVRGFSLPFVGRAGPHPVTSAASSGIPGSNRLWALCNPHVLLAPCPNVLMDVYVASLGEATAPATPTDQQASGRADTNQQQQAGGEAGGASSTATSKHWIPLRVATSLQLAVWAAKASSSSGASNDFAFEVAAWTVSCLERAKDLLQSKLATLRRKHLASAAATEAAASGGVNLSMHLLLSELLYGASNVLLKSSLLTGNASFGGRTSNELKVLKEDIKSVYLHTLLCAHSSLLLQQQHHQSKHAENEVVASCSTPILQLHDGYTQLFLGAQVRALQRVLVQTFAGGTASFGSHTASPLASSSSAAAHQKQHREGATIVPKARAESAMDLPSSASPTAVSPASPFATAHQIMVVSADLVLSGLRTATFHVAQWRKAQLERNSKNEGQQEREEKQEGEGEGKRAKRKKDNVPAAAYMAQLRKSDPAAAAAMVLRHASCYFFSPIATDAIADPCNKISSALLSSETSPEDVVALLLPLLKQSLDLCMCVVKDVATITSSANDDEDEDENEDDPEGEDAAQQLARHTKAAAAKDKQVLGVENCLSNVTMGYRKVVTRLLQHRAKSTSASTASTATTTTATATTKTDTSSIASSSSATTKNATEVPKLDLTGKKNMGSNARHPSVTAASATSAVSAFLKDTMCSYVAMYKERSATIQVECVLEQQTHLLQHAAASKGGSKTLLAVAQYALALAQFALFAFVYEGCVDFSCFPEEVDDDDDKTKQADNAEIVAARKAVGLLQEQTDDVAQNCRNDELPLTVLNDKQGFLSRLDAVVTVLFEHFTILEEEEEEERSEDGEHKKKRRRRHNKVSPSHTPRSGRRSPHRERHSSRRSPAATPRGRHGHRNSPAATPRSERRHSHSNFSKASESHHDADTQSLWLCDGKSWQSRAAESEFSALRIAVDCISFFKKFAAALAVGYGAPTGNNVYCCRSISHYKRMHRAVSNLIEWRNFAVCKSKYANLLAVPGAVNKLKKKAVAHGTTSKTVSDANILVTVEAPEMPNEEDDPDDLVSEQKQQEEEQQDNPLESANVAGRYQKRALRKLQRELEARAFRIHFHGNMAMLEWWYAGFHKEECVAREAAWRTAEIEARQEFSARLCIVTAFVDDVMVNPTRENEHAAICKEEDDEFSSLMGVEKREREQLAAIARAYAAFVRGVAELNRQVDVLYEVVCEEAKEHKKCGVFSLAELHALWIKERATVERGEVEERRQQLERVCSELNQRASSHTKARRQLEEEEAAEGATLVVEEEEKEREKLASLWDTGIDALDKRAAQRDEARSQLAKEAEASRKSNVLDAEETAWANLVSLWATGFDEVEERIVHQRRAREELTQEEAAKRSAELGDAQEMEWDDLLLLWEAAAKDVKSDRRRKELDSVGDKEFEARSGVETAEREGRDELRVNLRAAETLFHEGVARARIQVEEASSWDRMLETSSNSLKLLQLAWMCVRHDHAQLFEHERSQRHSIEAFEHAAWQPTLDEYWGTVSEKDRSLFHSRALVAIGRVEEDEATQWKAMNKRFRDKLRCMDELCEVEFNEECAQRLRLEREEMVYHSHLFDVEIREREVVIDVERDKYCCPSFVPQTCFFCLRVFRSQLNFSIGQNSACSKSYNGKHHFFSTPSKALNSRSGKLKFSNVFEIANSVNQDLGSPDSSEMPASPIALQGQLRPQSASFLRHLRTPPPGATTYGVAAAGQDGAATVGARQRAGEEGDSTAVTSLEFARARKLFGNGR